MSRTKQITENIVVDVIIPTYNHEKYIAQAIESVLNQVTSFNYRLIIGEDCSTDDTLRICQEYADRNIDKILLLSHSRNIGMAANYKALYNILTAKYIAILEGDDYWTDVYKLEKQVNVLESDQSIGLVHTGFVSLYEDGSQKEAHLFESIEDNSGVLIGPTQTAKTNIAALTACFRAELAKDNVDFDFIINNNLLTVDIIVWAEICRRSKVKYIDEITGVYRIHSNSLTGNREIDSIVKFHNTSMKEVMYLMDKYDTPQDVKDGFVSQQKLGLIYQYLLANQSLKAKSELQYVKKIRTIKEYIIYFAAKYRSFNFLAHLIRKFYRSGSMIKQGIGRLR